jgi:mycobactin lysine-N-oxygenase
VETVAGTVRHIEIGRGLRLRFEDDKPSRGYDFVVDATGFQPDWFHGLMTPAAQKALDAVLPDEDESTGLLERIPMLSGRKQHPTEQLARRLERTIGWDLAVAGLTPKLHLPMLAAIRQGPGFPNLSCLGLLSDRILQAYPGVAEPPSGKEPAGASA